MSSRYAGSTWIEERGWSQMSPLGRQVADILGYCWSGIYHLEDRYLREVEWGDPHQMVIRFRGELATYDFSHLTELVLLAHREGIRIAVAPKSNWTLELRFSRRYGGLGAHPSIGQVIQRVGEQWR
ncbi:hypothetical protein LCGC14_1109860 [marine sediment metagenome]|uniref:Uncharacterized protein n=1 Tax=marine sediment metagenome TaxID=412755 RepID=A0A0F9MV10_9ZZZZ